jgi:hypothetical protein
MLYDVFLLFFTHVVADVGEFSVLSSPQSHLVVFCSWFIIMSCLTIVDLLFFLNLCTVLYCTALSSESTELYAWCSLRSVNHLVNLCTVLHCTVLYCTALSSEHFYLVLKEIMMGLFPPFVFMVWSLIN